MIGQLRLFLAVASAIGFPLLAVGCGVGSTDEGEISETVTTYLNALADGDYAGACEQLAPAAKPEGDCPAAVEASVVRIPSDELSDEADGASEIAINGDAATVTLPSGATLGLRLVRDAWLVSSPYAG